MAIDFKAILDDSDSHCKFKDVENKFSNRADLHALILLSGKIKTNEGIIQAAEHDCVFLNFTLEQANELLTADEAVDLNRCGVGLCEYETNLIISV